MEPGTLIQCDAYYDSDAVCELLPFKRSSLDKERRNGNLRSVRKAGQFLYRGSWLIEWLERENKEGQDDV